MSVRATSTSCSSGTDMMSANNLRVKPMLPAPMIAIFNSSHLSRDPPASIDGAKRAGDRHANHAKALESSNVPGG